MPSEAILKKCLNNSNFQCKLAGFDKRSVYDYFRFLSEHSCTLLSLLTKRLELWMNLTCSATVGIQASKQNARA